MKYIKNLKNLSNIQNKLQFVNKQKICYENINNDEFNKYKSLWASKYISTKQEYIHENGIAVIPHCSGHCFHGQIPKLPGTY